MLWFSDVFRFFFFAEGIFLFRCNTLVSSCLFPSVGVYVGSFLIPSYDIILALQHLLTAVES